MTERRKLRREGKSRQSWIPTALNRAPKAGGASVAKQPPIPKPQLAQRFRELQSSRLTLHRLQPPRPLRDARATAAFVKERRIVMSTGRSSLPVLAEAIAGEPIAGSWMAHPAVYRIYHILGGLSRYNLPAAPLILGKETILDPSLGPAVERIAADPQRRPGARGQLSLLARRLLDEVEARGRVRMDQWDVPYREARRGRPPRLGPPLGGRRGRPTESHPHTP